MWRGYPAPRAQASTKSPPRAPSPAAAPYLPYQTVRGNSPLHEPARAHRSSPGVLCPRRANIPGDKPKSPLLLLKMNFWVKAHIDFLCDFLYDLLFALRVVHVSIYGAISLFLTTILSKLGGGCCVLSAVVFAAFDLFLNVLIYLWLCWVFIALWAFL